MSAFEREASEQHDDIDGLPSPAETQEVVGHRAVRGELDEAARSGRLHHGWLLQGPRGIGKATVAFDFTRRLIASGEDEEQAQSGSVAIRRQVAHGGHPNLMHLTRPAADRGGFRTQITVEEVRRLSHFFQTTAGRRWRIAVIDPAEDMNRNAANALLKILEEPPERSVFLLVNHQPGRLLPTIRSRCRVLRFEPLGDEEVLDALERIGAGDTQAEREAAAKHASGSVRTAALLLAGGGLEVTREIDRLYAGQAADWSGISKLADMLTVKGREAAFDLMTQRLFQLVGDEAERQLAVGERARAARLAAFWQSENARWREALAFNLDRKQVMITFFRGLAESREG